MEEKAIQRYQVRNTKLKHIIATLDNPNPFNTPVRVPRRIKSEANIKPNGIFAAELAETPLSCAISCACPCHCRTRFDVLSILLIGYTGSVMTSKISLF